MNPRRPGTSVIPTGEEYVVRYGPLYLDAAGQLSAFPVRMTYAEADVAARTTGPLAAPLEERLP